MTALQYLLQARDGDATVSGLPPHGREDQEARGVCAPSHEIGLDDLNEVQPLSRFMTAAQSKASHFMTDGLKKNMTTGSKRNGQHDNDESKRGLNSEEADLRASLHKAALRTASSHRAAPHFA